MKIKKFIESKQNLLLILATILVNIKSVFTDFGADNAYTMAMAVRNLRGDRLFMEMWEPHQTSVFVADILLGIYKIFVPNYTGAAIYLQIMGAIIWAVLGYWIYKEFEKVSGKNAALLAYIFVLLYKVKQSAFPEYANLCIIFATVLLLALYRFFFEGGKFLRLFVAATSLILAILSYPAAIILYFAVLFVFAISKKFTNNALSNNRLTSAGALLTFTGICMAEGVIYLGVTVAKTGFGRFVKTLGLIVSSDTHSDTKTSGYEYFRGALYAIAWVAVSLAVSWVISRILDAIKSRRHDTNAQTDKSTAAEGYAVTDKSTASEERAATDKVKVSEGYATNDKKGFLSIFGITSAVIYTIMLVGENKSGIDWTCVVYSIPLMLMVIGSFGVKSLDVKARFLWLGGVSIAIMVMIAAMLLTNLGLITIISFLMLGGVVSFIPIWHQKGGKRLLICILVIVAVHRGLVVWGYANIGHCRLVTEVENVIRSGPTVGIVTDYMTYYETEKNIEDFQKFVNEDDKVLTVGSWLIDPAIFVSSPGEISNYSVIDTPFYNETIEKYFEMYPDKKPTVVAVDCWYGGLRVDKDSYIMQWIEANYSTYEDGNYYRFYR